MTKRLFGSPENDQEVHVNAAKSIDFESKKRGLGLESCDQESEKIVINTQKTSRFKKSNLEKLSLILVDDIDSKTMSLDVGFASKIINIELDGAATKLQKVYKSYRTRRNLADCAVVVHELWWKALEFAALSRNSSVSFFDSDKTETAVSRWARARIMAAKVGKGLSKDDKAQNLALRHWLEAIDPRHRYGHNLHFYYKVWIQSETFQPFFYWLDVGDGKEVSLDDCPRTDLQQQCIKYLGPKEREAYEVTVDNGKLVYKQSRLLVSTVEGSKWIFVLGTSRNMYVGEKKKGHFQHSSFLAGGATIASGRLVVQNGLLQAIWAYSGHYKPTEENFSKLISFLEEHNVELTNVKKFPIDDDIPPVSKAAYDDTKNPNITSKPDMNIVKEQKSGYITDLVIEKEKSSNKNWSTGVGPRISCVRDYPMQLQFQALEHVKLSPRVVAPGRSCYATNNKNGTIPSRKPSPKIHQSPRIGCMGMGLPSPN